MLPKLIIVLFLLVILYTLGSAFWYLVHDKGEGDRTVNRLSWRIGLSLALFAMLYVFHLLGWIQPSTPGPIGLKAPSAERQDP